MNKALLVSLFSWTVAVCSPAACLNYADFNSTAGLTLAGIAAPSNGVLRLTPALDSQTGDAWLQGKQACAGGFDTTFHFRITTLGNIYGNEPGGDGFTFSVQNVGPTDASWAMGGTSNYVSVFFNTFWNWPGCTCPDVSDNSVGILVNQTYITQADLNPLGIQMSDGAVHQARILFDGAGISVWVDGINVLTNVPLAGLQPGVDNSGQGWVGFTAGTGAAYENHDILDWSFCPTNPPPPCVSAPSGVVSWWRGEGNALDSVDGNNGTLINGATFAGGEVGQSFGFDGVNDFVKIPQASNLNVGQVTIEFWMKADPTNAMNTYQGLVTGDFYGIEIANGFTPGPLGIEFFISTDGGATLSPSSFPNTADANGGPALISAGAWHHIAGTYDGTKLQLYIDGAPWGNPQLHSGSISPMLANSFVTIGAEDGRTTWQQFIGPRYFSGLIDEPTIYNRALSATEIQGLFNAGSAGKCPTNPPPPVCTAPPSGLVSWWRAENDALDSADGNNGTIQGPVNFVPGEAGQAFDFNGNYSGVQLGNPANLQLQTFTIDAWVKRHSSTQATLDPSHPDNGAFLHYDIGGYVFAPANDGRLLLGKVGVSAVYSSALRLTDTNSFHHVAVTTTGGNVVFYLDGVAESVGPYDPGYTFSGPVALGGRGGDLAASFYGAIDELSIYNRALSTAEIQALFNAGSAGKCPLPPSPPVVPIITSFSPVSAAPGSIIQILGTNFSPVASNNIVYCGAVRATVLASSPSLLQVMVPLSATYAPLTVAVNGLVAASGTPFQPEFFGGTNVTAASFAPRVDLAAPSGPIFTAIADLDGDGKPDLIVNNAYAHSLSLYRNLSITGSLDTNSFAAPVNFDVNGGDPDNPYGLTVADVDGDGKPDVVICNRLLSLVTVYRNIATPGSLTTGSLAPPVSFKVGTDPRHVGVADLNGDGKPDMVSANYGGGTISLLQNVGSAGTLTSNSFMAAVDLPAGSLSYEVAIADLDGDGKPDLAVTSDSFVLLFRNTGAGGNLGVGSFQSPAQLPAPSGTGIGIAVGDLDGDGKPDLVTCTYLSQTMSVFRNQATPGSLTAASFAPEVDFAPGDRGHTVALSDLNGDGKADIGFVGEIPDQFSVYQNVSTPGSFTTGSLAPRVDFATGYNAWGISIGDLDGDGRPDVVFCNSYATSISIYRNVIPGSNIPNCTPSPSGLVSWWRAEGNALDNVDGNNGTLVGGAGFGPGMVGQGFVFNGSGNAVSLGSAPNLQLQNFSIEAWIKRSDPTLVTPIPGQDSVFFSYGSGGYGFGINSLGHPFLTRIDITEVHSDTVIDDLTFHHVAMTKGGTNVIFYVDGVAYPASPYTDVFSFTTPAALGARGDTFGNSFLGTVDELTIYSNVLSAAEIAALYAAGSAGKCNPLTPPFISSQPTNRTVYVGQPATFIVLAGGSPPLHYQWLFEGVPLPNQTNAAMTIFNAQLSDAGHYSVVVSNAADSVTSSNALLTVNPLPTCTPPPAGLVSWWRFEKDVLDSWDSNNGTAPLGTLTSDGKVGQAFNFSQRFVVVPDSPSLHFSNALTIEAWVKPTVVSGPGPRTIVSKFDNVQFFPQPNQSSFFLGVTNNGQVCFIVSSNGLARTNFTLIAAQPLPTNAWTLVVATYDGTALRIYLNGSLAAQSNYSKGIFAGTDNLGIGALPFSGTTFSFPFSGLIDEVSLYNRALAADEIQSIYNSDFIGKCLVAPTIIAQPLSQVIPRNEDVKFSVSVVGTRPLKYQWRFGGRPVFGATNSTLILEKVQSNSIGFYTVLVSNSVGSVISADAALKLSPPLNCTPPPAGMISWWPADFSAFDAFDGNNGVLLGATYSPTGKVSQAFSFNGISSRVQVNNSASLNFGSNVNFSIEGWIKALPPPQAQSQIYLYATVPIVEKRSVVSSTGQGYSLLLNQGRLAFWIGTNINPSAGPNTNSIMFVSSGPDLRDGMFHHVAVTLDRSSTTGGRLFIDGNAVLTFDAFSRRGDLSNTSPLLIGAPTTTLSNSFFYGSIDELAIYNRSLTTNEIQAIAGAGSAGKCKVPPTIVTQPVSQTVPLGSNATFTVVATGSPTLRYQWFRTVGLITVPSTNSTLVFSNVTAQVLGTYFVRVTNYFGSVISLNAVLSQVPVSPPAGSVLQFSLTGGQPLLKFTGIAGQQYLIQASTNLVDWEVIGTATDLGDGNFEFVDPDWTNYNACFYRIILP